MDNFCDRCGSLLAWDFSDGNRRRICPRCGTGEIVEERTSQEPSPKEQKREFRVRKGVSPRSSRYASNAMNRTSLLTPLRPSLREHGKDRIRKVEVENGSPAPPMFPFDTIRRGQKEFMEDVGSTVENGGFLIANVPTGIGKTAASLSPAIEQALESGRMVMFMTSKQSQHRIAVDTLRHLASRSGRGFKVVDIVSKQSMCPRDISRLPHATFSFLCKQQSKDGTCPLFRPPPAMLTRGILSSIMDVNELTEFSLKMKICPHRAALEAAKEADVLICDFNYLFSDLSDTILS
jgi:DNA excision repair protein ERCC-2